MGISPREVSHLGLYRSYLKTAIVTLLRGGASLEVSVRELRPSESLNIKKDVPSLISEDLVRSLYRYSKSID